MRYQATWVVAMSVLKEAGIPLHYRTITQRVLESGRCGLGDTGQTPSQSVGTILRSKPHVFLSRHRGYYELRYRTLLIRMLVPSDSYFEVCQHLMKELRILENQQAWNTTITASSNGYSARSEVELRATVEVGWWDFKKACVLAFLRQKQIVTHNIELE